MERLVSDKRMKGPNENVDVANIAVELLAGYAVELQRREEFAAVLRELPPGVRRQFASRFSKLLMEMK